MKQHGGIMPMMRKNVRMQEQDDTDIIESLLVTINQIGMEIKELSKDKKNNELIKEKKQMVVNIINRLKNLKQNSQSIDEQTKQIIEKVVSAVTKGLGLNKPQQGGKIKKYSKSKKSKIISKSKKSKINSKSKKNKSRKDKNKIHRKKK